MLDLCIHGDDACPSCDPGAHFDYSDGFYVGMSIGIFIDGLVGHSAVVTEMVHGTIELTSEKALLIKADKGSCWVPKSGITCVGSYFRLKPWFKRKANPYFWDWVERNESISGVSA